MLTPDTDAWCLPQSLDNLIFLRSSLSLNLELTDLTRLGGLEAPGFFLSLPLQHWEG